MDRSWAERLERRNLFPRHLGIRIEELTDGGAVVALDLKPEHLQYYGVAHGGIAASLADTAVAYALLPHVGDGEETFTTDLHVRYLAAIREGPVRAAARLLRRGRTVVFAEVDVTDGGGRLAARVDTTWVIRRRSASSPHA
jgi:uncharacterized protein (TIGR00369 family)